MERKRQKKRRTGGDDNYETLRGTQNPYEKLIREKVDVDYIEENILLTGRDAAGRLTKGENRCTTKKKNNKKRYSEAQTLR